MVSGRLATSVVEWLLKRESRDVAVDKPDAVIAAVEADSGQSPADEGYVPSVLVLNAPGHGATDSPMYCSSDGDTGLFG